MKAKIHPKYYPEARIICACGNTYTTGSTSPELKVDICSQCHPFYTGEQRIVDTAGQVDRFMKRIQLAASEPRRSKRLERAAERRARIVTNPEAETILEAGGDEE